MKKIIYTLILIPALFLCAKTFGANYTIARFDNDWCATPYPSDYVAGKFSISEIGIQGNGNSGFTKSQTNETFFLDLPVGFEFNTSLPTVARVSASGTEVTIDSFYFYSATRLIVIISTLKDNIENNTIYFDNFGIRAMNGSASGDIHRPMNGGTFKIDNSSGIPGSMVSFGFLSAKNPFIYTSSSVDQPDTTKVKQYSINNKILRIKIKGKGNCGGFVTQFSFSTDGKNGTGTDSLRNITTAKVYYTGNSSVFAISSFFGSYEAPSGNFDISGSINLIDGDNYFWLCYDVPGDAYTGLDGNKLDASLISFAINGTITNMTTPSPTGYRYVVPSEFYYSRSSGNWTNNIWSTINNGPLCNCQPNGAGIVVIDTAHTVTMNATRTVDVMKIMKDASLIGQSSKVSFTATTELITYDNGFFDFLGDIAVAGNILLNGSGTSRFHKSMSIAGDLYIATGATLVNNGLSTLDVQIGGNLTVNGVLQNTGANLVLYGGNANIDGAGTINDAAYVVIKTGSKTVSSTANLTINAGLLIQGPYIVDNLGKINIRGNMDANNSASHWINKSGSDLSYGGSATMFASNGYLVAFSEFNTVHYSGSSNQSIVVAQNSTYYNLALEGSGTKLMLAETHLHGNLIFDATFGHNQKTIFVDGITMQYFSGSVPPILNPLYNLDMQNSAEGLTLQLPVSYAGHLTLKSGKIFTTMTNILTANDDATTSSGSTKSFVNGPMQKIGNDAFTFPVGKNSIWARLGISVPQTTGARFIAEYFDGKHINVTPCTPPLHHVSTVEYWNLLRSASSDSVKVELFWESAVRSGINDYPTLVVAGWDGASWLSKGQSAVTAFDPGNITSVVVKNFGPFTFGTTNKDTNPLPIVYLNYYAKAANGVVNITWSTSSETNNDYFTVQRSKDGISFEKLLQMDGAGNSNTVLDYSAIDYSPFEGSSYYRLMQTDFDGKFSFSNLMEVAIVHKKSDYINIYPNPFSSSTTVIINDASQIDNAELRIYNTFGEVLLKAPVTKHSTTLETSNLPSGIYFYEVISDNKTIQSGKLISQK